MTKSAETLIKKFFEAYAAATHTGDVDAIAGAYADTYIEAAPSSVTAYTVDAGYRKALGKKSKAMREQLGLQDAAVAVKKSSEFAPDHYLVETEWKMAFGAKDDDLARTTFRISYVVRLDKDSPKILLYVSHEDEEAVMKRDGIL